MIFVLNPPQMEALVIRGMPAIKSADIVLSLILLACALATQAIAGGLAQSGAEESKSNQPRDRGSSTVIPGKPVFVPPRTIRLPLHFSSGPGPQIGSVKLEVMVPAEWRYMKFDVPHKSGLKISASQRRNRGGRKGGEAPPLSVILSISASSDAIRDGLLGMLQFSAPPGASKEKLEEPGSVSVRILSALPPAADHDAGDKPFELPAEPPANPAVACFFFSH
jgi:hypothetical protein